MLEELGESEHVEAAKRIIAEHIEAWYDKLRSREHPTFSQAISAPLRNVINLDLEASGLRTLPPSGVLGALPCLQVLNLRNNKLRGLNGGLLQCRTLEELYLDSNYLRSIKGELKNIHCLRILTARGNQIDNLQVS